MKVQSYLAFNGNCQEALNFYGEIFNAEVKIVKPMNTRRWTYLPPIEISCNMPN